MRAHTAASDFSNAEGSLPRLPPFPDSDDAATAAAAAAAAAVAAAAVAASGEPAPTTGCTGGKAPVVELACWPLAEGANCGKLCGGPAHSLRTSGGGGIQHALGNQKMQGR